MGITAEQLKNTAISWMLYDRGFLGAVTESYNSSDVLGIRYTLYSVEIEVKIQRGDLRSELRTIEEIKDSIICPKGNKSSKHVSYLRPKIHPYSFIPNEFYFFGPEEILKGAGDILADTPYGLMVYLPDRKYWQEKIKIIKRAKKLHMTKVTNYYLVPLLRKVSVENCVLRTRTVEAEKREEIKSKIGTTELIFPEWFEPKYFIKTAEIDNQLVKEIKSLWGNGIQTTACCSGHGDTGFISVKPEHIHKMEKLGYKYFAPGFEIASTHFKPKTVGEK